ncbi:hypothetical protein [Pedobacter sp. SYSU D00535]|uniref:hypothetical protein n=1 Tax=Pedobacter sp. SYSU D00535 TaxID=2810308 RepID=UPI001A9600B3|nr:hypothetical protein [Pedobacter sp. SYSU D00535]
MDKFDIQVMLADGSFTDFEIQNERGENSYEVFQKNEKIGTFQAGDDGSWTLTENPGNINEDLRNRIINQLNGFRR